MKKIIAITALGLLSTSVFAAKLDVTLTSTNKETKQVSHFTLPITNEATFAISDTSQQLITGYISVALLGENEQEMDDQDSVKPVFGTAIWGDHVALVPRKTEGMYEFSIGRTTKPDFTEETFGDGLKYTVVGPQVTQKYSSTILVNSDKEVCSEAFSAHNGKSVVCYKRID